MGLFDLFKKNKTDDTFPENELEKSLMQAANDPTKRKEFYTKLLWNELYVLTSGEEVMEPSSGVLEKDTEVKFQLLEDGSIPVFTSTNRIFDKGVIKEQVPYMALKGQDLFGFTQGATFVLNPFSDYGKELLPDEIDHLLNGTLFETNREMEIPSDTEIQIGQPAIYPENIVNELKALFENRPRVKAAYLAAIKMDENEKLPHLIVGIDVEGEHREIFKEAGPLAEKHLSGDDIIDFIKIDETSGISDYFLNSTEPFYRRER